MAKTKKKTISNVSLEDAQAASQQYAEAANALARIEAKMNHELNAVKSKYQDDITVFKTDMEEPMETLEVFAKEQKTSWGKKKSFELLHSIIGFRTGTPKVEKSKKFTWDGIVELLKRARLTEYIRTKEEVNKEAVIAEKHDEAVQLLAENGLTVVQDEVFYVEAKTEEVAV